MAGRFPGGNNLLLIGIQTTGRGWPLARKQGTPNAEVLEQASWKLPEVGCSVLTLPSTICEVAWMWGPAFCLGEELYAHSFSRNL